MIPFFQMFIDKRIVPKLGSVKLNKLRAIEIQKFYNELRRDGRLREAQKSKLFSEKFSELRSYGHFRPVPLFVPVWVKPGSRRFFCVEKWD